MKLSARAYKFSCNFRAHILSCNSIHAIPFKFRAYISQYIRPHCQPFNVYPLFLSFFPFLFLNPQQLYKQLPSRWRFSHFTFFPYHTFCKFKVSTFFAKSRGRCTILQFLFQILISNANSKKQKLKIFGTDPLN